MLPLRSVETNIRKQRDLFKIEVPAHFQPTQKFHLTRHQRLYDPSIFPDAVKVSHLSRGPVSTTTTAHTGTNGVNGANAAEVAGWKEGRDERGCV